MELFEELYLAGGALPSPDDERDYQLDSLIMKAVLLPDKYIVPVPAIIADQGKIGCCVAATQAQIKHCQEYSELGDKRMFSAAYVYANRTDEDFQGSGMYPREACQHMVESGTCYEEDFPGYNQYEYDDIHSMFLDNKKKLDRLAKPYRASSYYRLNNIDDIKMALYTSESYVQVCYPIYKNFYYPDENGYIDYKHNSIIRGKNYGGHSVTCCGYDDEKQALCIINSWGKNYGVGVDGVADGGCVWVSYEYPISEAWAIIDAKTEKEIIEAYQ